MKRLASGYFEATSIGHPLGIFSVNQSEEVRFLHILAKARLILFQSSTTFGGRNGM